VAVSLARGDVTLADFAESPDAAVGVADLRGRVRVVPDPRVATDEAHVAVTDRAGRVRAARAIYRGGAGAWRPEELDAKFVRHAAPVLGRAGAETLRDLVLGLESVGDSAEVTRACRGTR